MSAISGQDEQGSPFIEAMQEEAMQEEGRQDMSKQIPQVDGRYHSLVSPIKSIGPFIETNQEELLEKECDVYEGTTFKRLGRITPQRGLSVLRVGELDIIAGKATPVQSTNSSGHFSRFLAMPFGGGFTCRHGAILEEV